MRNHCGCGAEKEMHTDATEHTLQRQQVNVIAFFLWRCRVVQLFSCVAALKEALCLEALCLDDACLHHSWTC